MQVSRNHGDLRNKLLSSVAFCGVLDFELPETRRQYPTFRSEKK